MKNIVLTAALASFCFSCSRDVPEGVYSCRPETVTRDCPGGWSCRMDSRCWSTPDPRPDAGSGVDGSSSSDVGVADAALDGAAGCVAASETCNDQDDDCDGMIDEGLLVVQPPVLVDSARHASGINIVAGNGHFILVSDASDHYVSEVGEPSAALNLHIIQGSHPPALAFDGTRLLIGQSGGSLTARPQWSLGDYAPGATLLLNATTTSVTAYVSGRRSDLDTSSGTWVVESAHQTIGTASPDLENWAGVRAGRDEVVLFGPDLWRMDGADVATPMDLGRVTTEFGKESSVAIAVRDPHADVSPVNPLAVVYLLRGGGTSPGAHFLEITSLQPLAIGSSRPLAGSMSAPTGAQDGQSYLAVVAAPDGDRETRPGHWYVVSYEYAENPGDPTGFEDAALHVWEISVSQPDGWPVTVPQNGPSWATSIAVATLGSTIRVASESPIGLATRGIGCHF